MNEVFFTADTHFGHRFMAEWRGFASLEEHDEFVLEQWNATVDPKDEVWFLGDFSFAKKEENPRIFHALNGRKHLVAGNHDPANVQELPWSSVNQIARRKFNGKRYVMCHFPMLTWQNAHHGALHLHGHTHGNLRAPESTRLDVGWDCHPESRPFSLSEVESAFEHLVYDYIDHHE